MLGSVAVVTDTPIVSATASPTFVSRARSTDHFTAVSVEFVATIATAVDTWTPIQNAFGGSFVVATDANSPSNTRTLLITSQAVARDVFTAYSEALFEDAAEVIEVSSVLVQSAEVTTTLAVGIDAATPSNNARPMTFVDTAVAADWAETRQTMGIVYEDSVVARITPVPSIPMRAA